MFQCSNCICNSDLVVSWTDYLCISLQAEWTKSISNKHAVFADVLAEVVMLEYHCLPDLDTVISCFLALPHAKHAVAESICYCKVIRALVAEQCLEVRSNVRNTSIWYNVNVTLKDVIIQGVSGEVDAATALANFKAYAKKN